MDLSLLFQNSFILLPTCYKTLRHSEEIKFDNFHGLQNKFDEYYSRFKILEKSIFIDHISQFKAILLLDKKIF